MGPGSTEPPNLKPIPDIGDGVCDAVVLSFFERRRAAGRQSSECLARQLPKRSVGDEPVRPKAGKIAAPKFPGEGYSFSIVGARRRTTPLDAHRGCMHTPSGIFPGVAPAWGR